MPNPNDYDGGFIDGFVAGIILAVVIFGIFALINYV